jgi:cardiolipin synthase C
LLRFAVSVAAACSLTACATGLPAVDAPPSHALPVEPTGALPGLIAAVAPDSERSGFRLLPTGAGAWHAREVLMARAEASIDVQQYHVKPDATGRAFLRALADAGRRGVRVRLLLDDLHTDRMDELLLGLAAQPGVEVRLFNPFVVARGGLALRLLSSLHDFARVHRRMHNKLLVADGAMAVIGGRNVGDEYYLRSESDYFFDLDVLAAGPVVPQLSRLLDAYWNSAFAVPAAAVLRSEVSVAEAAVSFLVATQQSEPEPLPPNDPLGQAPLGADMAAGPLRLHWSHAQAMADGPGKVLDDNQPLGLPAGTDFPNLADYVALQLGRARTEVLVVSPYLVPYRQGMERIRAARARGVRIVILTNSLASTDEPLVQTAYSTGRLALLREGVELYELSATLGRRSMRAALRGTPQLRLHTKCFVIDREAVFIGSMNLDPRSRRHNTEIGVMVHSPGLARDVAQIVELQRARGAYRVQLAAGGNDAQWTWIDDGGHERPRAPPDLGWWQRLWLNLLAPLVPEHLL